jgi:hypothetical protein
MKRESFLMLDEQMKLRKAFKGNKFKKQHPVSYQLLVFLFRVGREGTGGSASAVSSYFGMSKGSVINYVRRCVSAPHKIKEQVVY